MVFVQQQNRHVGKTTSPVGQRKSIRRCHGKYQTTTTTTTVNRRGGIAGTETPLIQVATVETPTTTATPGNSRPLTTATTTVNRRGGISGTGAPPIQVATAETPTTTATPARHGFLLQHRGTAPAVIATQQQIENANINATTGMLLNMRNMTDEEIGHTYRDVRIEEQSNSSAKQNCSTGLSLL